MSCIARVTPSAFVLFVVMVLLVSFPRGSHVGDTRREATGFVDGWASVSLPSQTQSGLDFGFRAVRAKIEPARVDRSYRVRRGSSSALSESSIRAALSADRSARAWGRTPAFRVCLKESGGCPADKRKRHDDNPRGSRDKRTCSANNRGCHA